MRADYVDGDVLELLLTALMPANRLALQVSLCTGLRIGDVLALRTERLQQRMTIEERKTGKHRRIYLPVGIYEALLRQAGEIFVFPSRLSERRHRTRQAVYKDLRRVSELYRLDGKKIAEHLSPHSARKIYAVSLFRSRADAKKVQQLLQHSSEAVTMLYAMADTLTAAKLKAEGKAPAALKK